MTQKPDHSRQLSFREEEHTAAQVVEAAEQEELPVADFIRKLFRFAFRRYQEAGSLHALRVDARRRLNARRGVAPKPLFLAAHW